MDHMSALDLNLHVLQLRQFLDGLDIGCAHIESGDDAKLTAALRELGRFLHDQPPPDPLDERQQHINALG